MAKFVKAQLDKERMLRLDINALSDLEEVLGVGIVQIVSDRRIGLNTLRAMLWASLRWKERSLSLADAGNIMQAYLETDEGSLEQLTQYLMEALEHSGIIGKKQEAEDAVVEDEGNGESSTTLPTG